MKSSRNSSFCVEKYEEKSLSQKKQKHINFVGCSGNRVYFGTFASDFSFFFFFFFEQEEKGQIVAESFKSVVEGITIVPKEPQSPLLHGT